MNDQTVQNWALGLAVFSFGFLSIGSFLFGATAVTSVLRGVGGGLLFGAMIWLIGSMIVKEEEPMDQIMSEEEDMQELESAPATTKTLEPQSK